MSKSVLGLDVRDDSISAVLVKAGLKGAWVEAYTRVRISGGESENGLSESLGRVMQAISPSGNICVCGFPADRASFRNIQVPLKGPKKIRQILPFELEPTLPFAVDDLVIDFQTIDAEHSNSTEILASAVRTEDLKPLLELLHQYGADPETLTISGYAAALCIGNTPNIPKNWLLIDLDKEKTALYAASNGKICLIRSFPAGMDAARLNDMMHQTGTAFEGLFHREFRPETVFISGAGIPEGDFERMLETLSGFKVQRLDLLQEKNIRLAATTDLLWAPEEMNGALGLALLGMEGFGALNFRKGALAARKQWEEHKRGFVRTGILAAVALVLALSNFILDSYSMEKRVAELDKRIVETFKAAFPDVGRIVDPLQQMRGKIQELQKTAPAPGDNPKTIRVVDLLNAISINIPSEIDVEIEKLVMGPESTQVSGNTDTFNSVDEIKNRLEKSGVFRRVVIGSANMEKSGNRVNFNLNLQF
jgi:general secretion pathway protein L